MTHYQFEIKLQKELGLRNRPVRHQSKEHAFSSLKRYLKPAFVVEGNDGRYWVVCLRDACRLKKLGFKPV